MDSEPLNVAYKMPQAVPTWAEPSAPLFVHLIITRVCNWSCPFCVIKNNKAGIPDVSALLAVVSKLAEAGVMDVTLFGGEPLLHPHALDVGKAIQDHGMNPGFVSNGNVRVSPKRLVKTFSQASVSIHGPENVHDKLVGKRGAWRHAVSFIKEYVGSGGRASVCVTVEQGNLDSFADFCAGFADEVPLVSFVVNPVIPFPGLSDALDGDQLMSFGKALANLTKALAPKQISVTIGSPMPFCALPPEAALIACACHAGTIFAMADYLGNIHICPERDTPVGNLFEKSVTDIWRENSEYGQMSTRSFVDEECKTCRAYPWCLAGCRSTRETSPTTDKRIVGKEAAERNIKAIQESLTDDVPAIQLEDLPQFVSIHPKVRGRAEEFGMFVVSEKGQPFALDSDGKRFFSYFLDRSFHDWLAVGQREGFLESETTSFVRQGLHLGLFIG